MGIFGPPDVEKMKARRNVKGLIKALSYRNDWGVRVSAVRTLGKFGDSRAVESLIATLNDANRFVCAASAEALGEIGDVRAVKPLIDALKDGDRNMNIAAARALGAIGDAQAVEPLIDFIKINSTVAEEALIKIGKPAVKTLLPILNSESGLFDIRLTIVNALGEIGDTEAVEPLINALRDRSRAVCEAAAKSLKNLGWEPDPGETGAWYWIAKRDWEKVISQGVSAVEPLSVALKSKDWDVRIAAAKALGELREPQAVEPLIHALKDEFCFDVRKAAAMALDKLGWGPDHSENGALYWIAKSKWKRVISIGTSAVEPLIATLKKYEIAREAVVEALVEIGEPAVKPLIVILKDKDKNVRKTAARTLEKLGWKPDHGEAGAWYWVAKHDWKKAISLGTSAIAPLLETLKDKDYKVRMAAADLLVTIYYEGALDQRSKQRILAVHGIITDPHQDGILDCLGGHTDSGIGVDFPL